jgi:3-phosphoshikimate 1-carboxyvinyltransferase
MDLIVEPLNKELNGEIIAPPSKSYSHRAFIAASLANGTSLIENPLVSGDVKITLEVLRKLGVNISRKNNKIYKISKKSQFFNSIKEVIQCQNSGTTIRIFSALALLFDKGISFKGEFFVRKRPIKPLLNVLENLGAKYELAADQLHVERIENFCQDLVIRGDISSQFLTALLFLCPIITCGDKKFILINLKTPIKSYPYIKITLDVLRAFGIEIQEKLNRTKMGSFKISLNQRYQPTSFKIPGDFSSASFIIAAVVLSNQNSKVSIENLDMRNPQGDKKFIKILSEMGAKIRFEKHLNKLVIEENPSRLKLRGLSINCEDIPDLFPILSVIGAFVEDKLDLHNAYHIRMKESDRISVMKRELSKMGVRIEERKDGMTIFPCKHLEGAVFNHENDHRIAMALTVASLYAHSPSIIRNIEIVKDSYPNFLNDLRKLGAKIIIKDEK